MEDRPNVILLIFDTLRADTLYGELTSTPTLDRISAEGAIFDRAYSSAPITSISHASMFTGQHPSETGVMGQTDIPKNIPMLAGHLREHGYDTFGIAGPGRMGSEWGYNRGFEEYFEAYEGDKPDYPSMDFFKEVIGNSRLREPLIRDLVRKSIKGTDKMTSLKFDYLAETVEKELEPPFFGMVNTTMVHTPYNPPRPYKEEVTPEVDRPKWYLFEELFTSEESINRDDVREEHIYNAQSLDGKARYLEDEDYLTESEMGILRDWYRASLEYLDTKVAALLDKLEHRSHLDDTVLIITSDHGEHFGENGRIGHGSRLFEQSLHVPLIIRGSNIPPTNRSDFVSLVDLFPTICDLLSLPIPPELSGQSMFSGDSRTGVSSEYGPKPTDKTADRKYLSEAEIDVFSRGRKTIRTNRYRYELDSEGEELLYTYPDEERISDPDPNLLEELRSKMFNQLDTDFVYVFGEEQKLSDDLKENLRKLGYIE